MTNENLPAFSDPQDRPAAETGSPDAGPRRAVRAEAAPKTNQAERAAMHPEGYDLEWHYYHGAWSG